jgi:hypothetical protein
VEICLKKRFRASRGKYSKIHPDFLRASRDQKYVKVPKIFSPRAGRLPEKQKREKGKKVKLPARPKSKKESKKCHFFCSLATL